MMRWNTLKEIAVSIISKVAVVFLALFVIQAAVILLDKAPAEVIVAIFVAAGAISWAASTRIY